MVVFATKNVDADVDVGTGRQCVARVVFIKNSGHNHNSNSKFLCSSSASASRGRKRQASIGGSIPRDSRVFGHFDLEAHSGVRLAFAARTAASSFDELILQS